MNSVQLQANGNLINSGPIGSQWNTTILRDANRMALTYKLAQDLSNYSDFVLVVQNGPQHFTSDNLNQCQGNWKLSSFAVDKFTREATAVFETCNGMPQTFEGNLSASLSARDLSRMTTTNLFLPSVTFLPAGPPMAPQNIQRPSFGQQLQQNLGQQLQQIQQNVGQQVQGVINSGMNKLFEFIRNQ